MLEAVVASATSAWVRAEAITGAAVADWLAAIAAAAIASGAVPLPEVGDGVAMMPTVTGTATATGVGTTRVVGSELVVAVGVLPESDVEAEIEEEEASPEEDAVVEFLESSCESVDLPRERGGGALLPGPALLSGAGPLLAFWLFELLFAGAFAA